MDTWKYDITEVFFLAILEKQLEVSKEYFHDICLCNRETKEIFYEGLSFTFIELSNFVKTSDELESDLDRWLYSLKPIFEKLYNIAEYTNMTKEEQEVYDEQRKRKWDNEAVQAQQRLDNLAEGEEKKAREIALEMKKEGYTMDQIVKITKLSAEEINAL